MGTAFQSEVASGKYKYRYMPVLEWGTWRLYSSPLELQFLGSSRLAAGFKSARPCGPCLTLSLTAGFLAGAEPPWQRHLRWG